MQEYFDKKDSPAGNGSIGAGKSKNSQSKMKASFEKMLSDALADGKLEDAYYEELQKLSDMLERISGGIIEEEIRVLKETFEEIHNSKKNLEAIEEQYDSIMRLASECGTIKDVYQTEIRKLAVVAKNLPPSVFKAKKSLLEKSCMKAYNGSLNPKKNKPLNFKTPITLIILLAVAFFLYVKAKEYISFHSLTAEEKARSEQMANELYNEGHDIDEAFHSHEDLQKILGKKNISSTEISKNGNESVLKNNMNSIKNQIEESDRQARIAAKNEEKARLDALKGIKYVRVGGAKTTQPSKRAIQTEQTHIIDKLPGSDAVKNKKSQKGTSVPPVPEQTEDLDVYENCEQAASVYSYAKGRNYKIGDSIDETALAETKKITEKSSKYKWKIKSLCKDGRAILAAQDDGITKKSVIK